MTVFTWRQALDVRGTMLNPKQEALAAPRFCQAMFGGRPSCLAVVVLIRCGPEAFTAFYLRYLPIPRYAGSRLLACCLQTTTLRSWNLRQNSQS